MNRFLFSRKYFLLSTLLLGSLLSVSQAQPGKSKAPKKVKKGLAVRRAEAIVGHPLTEAQTKAIQAAVRERIAATKPITAKFNASVAKTLGMSVTEFEKRLKETRPKPRKPTP